MRRISIWLIIAITLSSWWSTSSPSKAAVTTTIQRRYFNAAPIAEISHALRNSHHRKRIGQTSYDQYALQTQSPGRKVCHDFALRRSYGRHGAKVRRRGGVDR